MAPIWRYSQDMPSVQIKNVPADVHRVLRRRAGDAGQSLQEYLLALLEDHARTPTLDEMLERAGGRAGGSLPLSEAADLVRAERDSR
jgi:antitoxin FitA